MLFKTKDLKRAVKNVESQHIQLNAVLVRHDTLPMATKEATSNENYDRSTEAFRNMNFVLQKPSKKAERQRIDAEEHEQIKTFECFFATPKFFKRKGLRRLSLL